MFNRMALQVHRPGRWRRQVACIIALAAVLMASRASADEGMWTFDQFPANLVRAKYGVEITPAWLTTTSGFFFAICAFVSQNRIDTFVSGKP